MRAVDLSSYSGIGKRTNNEDAFIVKENSEGLLALVCDGLGGQDNGEYASQAAVETITAYLDGKPISAEALGEAITLANEAVCKVQEEHPGAQTTVAAVWLGDNSGEAMNVGDSRIYQFRDGEIVYQSVDHTLAQLAVMTGELKPEEIRGTNLRNRLFRALGDAVAPKIGEKQLEILSGDRLLICSDGFWEGILEDEMLKIAERTDNAEDWLTQMRSIAEPAASDNNTAIAIVIS